MAIYKILADLVVILHAAYVGFVVFGFLLILVGAARRWRWVRGFWFRVIHLMAIAVVCGEAILGIECPLTTLENYLRRVAGTLRVPSAAGITNQATGTRSVPATEGGQTGYAADFIGHWVHELIFFDAPPWVFTVVYVAFGILILATFLFAPPQLPWRRPDA